MTNDQRRDLEDRIVAYGRAKSETSYAVLGGSEAQEDQARCYEADAWLAIQDALSALERESA